MKESTTQLKKNTAAEQVREYCENQVKTPRMHPSTRDAIMRGVKEGKYSFNEETGYAIPFSEFQAIYSVGTPSPKPQPRSSIHGSSPYQRTALYGRAVVPESGEGEDEETELMEFTADGSKLPAGELVDRMVKKYCVVNKVDYSTGMKAVIQSNPKLAHAYIEATPIVRTESFEGGAADVEGEG